MSSAEERLNEQLNPFLGTVPSDETGPGASFAPVVTSTVTPKTPTATTSARPITPTTSSPQLASNNPFRRSSASHGTPKETTSTSTREVTPTKAYPSPPPSASPRNHRQELYNATSSRPRRSSSLKERFPGDPSVRPLDTLAREKQIADKARHVTRKHHIAPDTIDNLDNAGPGHYHHEGPYDATLLARNNSYLSSPVAAVASTNAEALKATPHEKIVDSVQGHRPLEGVAAYPPGTTDREGRTYHYQEGENMMVDLNPGGGAYKRWPGVEYHPDDIKGKGEPSYSIEKALKDHHLSDKLNDREVQGIEMQDRGGNYIDMEPRTLDRELDDTPKDTRHTGAETGTASGAYAAFRDNGHVDDLGAGPGRRESLGGKIKRRIGSLRRKDD